MTYLDIGNNKISEIGAAKLAPVVAGSKLTHLNMANNKLKNEGAIIFSGLLMGAYSQTCMLRHLNLSNNRITG